MRYTTETIEALEAEVDEVNVVQKHHYTIDYSVYVPKGRKITGIHYVKGDYAFEPGSIILELDNGDTVETSFDIGMLWESLSLKPCSYQAKDDSSNLIFQTESIEQR